MASDQVRREKTTIEPVVIIEKDKVPKMTSHFESLTEKAKDSDIGGKETRHESGKDRSDDSRARSGNTVGEVGAPGKARESHEMGIHEFESLSDRVKDIDEEHVKDKERASYADKARSANMVGDKELETRKAKQEHEEKTRGPHNVGKFEVSGEEGRSASEAKGKMEGHEEKLGRSRGMQQTEESHKEKERGIGMQGTEEGREKQEQPSLEQISQLRGTAQEKSMEAIRAAEERYNQTKEEARRKLDGATEYAAEKGSQAKDALLQGAEQTSQYVAEKGSQAKDTALEKGQQGYEAAKDTLYKAKDYTVPKAEQAKDYRLEKVAEAKEAAVDTTKKVASYTEEKAAAAKESGEGAAEYAGKVAVAAGWSTVHYATEKAVEGTAAVAKAAQYTTEKVVEGTKAAARAVEGATEYAGHKAVEIVSKPLGAAKEAAVATGESMEDYTARKKEEAQRGLEAKRAERQDTERGYQGGDDQGEQQQSVPTKTQEKVEDVARPITDTIQETFQGASEQGKKEKETTEYRGEESPGGGVLQAIGETVVEIAQTTKDLVIGEGETGEKILGSRSSQVGEGKQGETEHRQ